MKILILTISLIFSSLIYPDQEMIVLDEAEYSISYPSNWIIDRSNKLTEFYLFSRLDSPSDKFSENMSLISQNIVGMNIDLDKYTQISVNQIKRFFKDKILTVKKHQNKDGLDYYEVIYIGKQDGSNLKFLQYNFVENGMAYVLTFTAEASQFDRYKDIAYQTFNSFRLKNASNN